MELSCYQFQCLHDHESSYDSIGGGNGGYDASCHGWRGGGGDNIGGERKNRSTVEVSEKMKVTFHVKSTLKEQIKTANVVLTI